MIHSNQFPQQGYQHRYGADKISREKRYDLKYRNQVLCSNVAYPVAVSKKNDLIKSNPKNWNEKHFLIQLHK